MSKDLDNKHSHDWIIAKDNVPYRDEYGNKFIIDFYVCECGAGSRVTTPKEIFDKGLKSTEFTDE